MGAALIQAEARRLPLPDQYVQCVITSPPYFGLRDYGLGAAGIGLELTPDAYVAALVAVFREVWRVLRDDGTVWLNIGDSYTMGVGSARGLPYKRHTPQKSGLWTGTRSEKRDIGNNSNLKDCGDLKPKDLLGIPWMVAFALRSDGWYLRADIIWAKPNPMPELVTDRPAKAHEYLFLLSKAERYYYDAEAIKEPANRTGKGRARSFRGGGAYTAGQSFNNSTVVPRETVGNTLVGNETRNCRSVWTIATQPYPGAHYATFPEALVEPCLLAGSASYEKDPARCSVLDLFCGSGTVGVVAWRHQRAFIGCDLKLEYLKQAQARMAASLER